GALERPASQPKRVQSCAAARTATTQTAHPASVSLVLWDGWQAWINPYPGAPRRLAYDEVVANPRPSMYAIVLWCLLCVLATFPFVLGRYTARPAACVAAG